jgi:signal transduction histidine kinase
MTRRWLVWAFFALCVGVMLAAVGGVSATALRLERAEAEARRAAAVEEDVRLALWRMDSAVAPLVARESARPYFVYAPLYAPERAYTRMLSELGEGDVLVPSPLLTDPPERVLLHFQVGPDGAVTSPQVPTGTARAVAARRYTTVQEVATATKRLDELRPLLVREKLLAAASEPAAEPRGVVMPAAAAEGKKIALNADPTAVRSAPAKSSLEYETRSRQMSQNFSSSSQGLSKLSPVVAPTAAPAAVPVRATAPPASRRPALVAEGAMTPVWLGDRLILLRRVRVGGAEYLQGCLLDWTAIRGWLEEEVSDLFPAARVVPAPGPAGDDPARLLAALPAQLVTGPRPAAPGDRSPLRAILAATWAMVLLAGGAVLALLLGIQSLSDRRAAFVSSVTHELRTPLTTFRMYAEMLADGMLADEARRREYLETLRRESLRLGHLVENVLAYGRVERGRISRSPEPLQLGDLLERHGDRLRERARSAGMELRLDVPGDLTVLGEPGAIEQILFNLVDNACKYARRDGDERIEVSAAREGRRVAIRVRDHGPGVLPGDRRRLFVPFGRSAAAAAGSAPGVGLGLALCRSLATSLRGSLELEDVDGPGASFVLRLRAA